MYPLTIGKNTISRFAHSAGPEISLRTGFTNRLMKRTIIATIPTAAIQSTIGSGSVFQPTPIRFRDLSRHLPAGVALHVPERFREAIVQGDPVAGGHVWRYEGGEVALWWVPGPSEPLLLNTAIVMLETTHDSEEPPTVSEGEEILWQERPGFFFTETWLDEDDVPAQAWVLQGPDYWLYVLRVRPTSDEMTASLLQQVAETFEFVDTP